MKKILVVIVVLIIAAVGVTRMLYGRWLSSPASKDSAERQLTQLFGNFVPGATATIGLMKASGLSAIQLERVVVKTPHDSLKIKLIQVKPGYLAALFGKAIPFSLDAVFEPKGALSVAGVAVRQEYADFNLKDLQLTANLLSVDAAQAVNARFFSGKNSKARMATGTISGRLQLRKSGSHPPSGSFAGTIDQIDMRFGQLGGRTLKIPSSELKFAFEQQKYTLSAPLVASTVLGKLTFTGGLTVTAEPRWDMKVDPQNNPLLRVAAAALFRCQSVPGTGTIDITGPTSAPICQ